MTPDLDTVLKHYIACALWASTDNSTPQGGEPLDANYGPDDLSDEAKASMRKDCEDFLRDAKELWESYPHGDEQIGHDFWLTRNGHGAGFWDRGDGELGQKLSDIACEAGDVDLIVGDDGKIHCE